MRLFFKCTCCEKMADLDELGYKTTEDEKLEKNAICHACYSNRMDAIAFFESDGIFRNYEDWKEDQGCTIAYTDTNVREY